MENCNYDRPELMVLNMVRKGLFGEVLHAECGYLHDLREVKFSTRGRGAVAPRRATKRNGNLYPTHGLGPVANCLDINRGDRFAYLVSMSGPSRGLQRVRRRALPAGRAAAAARQYVLGDVNVEPDPDGERQDDLRQPRHQPAAALQPDPPGAGHQGIVPGISQPGLHRGAEPGRTGGRRWRAYYAEYDHPLWRISTRDPEGGRARRDGLPRGLPARSSACARGLPTDMNVYDAAALSAVVRAERAIGGEGERADGFPGLHARPVEDPRAARHRPRLNHLGGPHEIPHGTGPARRREGAGRGLLRRPDPARGRELPDQRPDRAA